MNTPPEITDPLLKSLSDDALDLPRMAALEARKARKIRDRNPRRSFHPLEGLVWLMRFRAAQAAVALLILAAMIKGGSIISGERFHTTNPIIARIAFWTDDESRKADVNTAGDGKYWAGAQGSGGSGTFTVDSIPPVPTQAFNALADDAPVTFWSPYGDESSQKKNQKFATASTGTWNTITGGSTTNWLTAQSGGSDTHTILGANYTINSLNFTGTDSAVPTGHEVTISGNNVTTGTGVLESVVSGTTSTGDGLHALQTTGTASAVILSPSLLEKARFFAGGNDIYTAPTTIAGGSTLQVDSGAALSVWNGHNATVDALTGSGTISRTITNQPGNITFRPVAGYSQTQGNFTLSVFDPQSKVPGSYGYTPVTPGSPAVVEYDATTGKRHATEFNPPKVPNLDKLYSTVDGYSSTGGTKKPVKWAKTKLVLAQNSPAQKPGHPMQEALAQQAQPAPGATPAPVVDTRKLIRNATLDFEVASFEKALDVITSVAGEEQGYVFSQNSAKGANGKLQGQVIVKVPPGNLDRFLLKLRLLGDMKNQTVSAQDVSKDYYDTEARIRNSQVTEQRLIDMMKTRTGKVSDLLEVENEISRVRGEIEQMQGQLKVYDAQVQFATVAITLQEKDLNQTAAYLLQEHAQLSLFAKDVEKAFTEAKGDAEAAKAQTLDSHMERDEAGHVVATLHLLIPPGASDETIGKLKAIGRIEHFNSQTQSIARNGSDNSDTAKVDRDKVELNLVIQHDAENAVQGTNISVQTDKVEDKTYQIKQAAAAAGVEVKGAEFNRAQNGMEVSAMLLRMPVKKYPAFLEQIKSLGKVKGFTVARREDATATEDAPAEIYLQIYSQPGIVSDNTGLWVTVRHTIGEGLSALMWSLRMIGVSLAFIAPWVIIGGLAWFLVVRRRRRLAQK